MIHLRHLLIFAIFFVCFRTGFAQSKTHIIPRPVTESVKEGHFNLNQDTRIIYDNASARRVAELFIQSLKRSTGFQPALQKGTSSEPNRIFLHLHSAYDTTLGTEGYRLKVTTKMVEISANKPNGLFYGLQSFKQLLPPEIESHSVVKDVSWQAPCINITDFPAFGWRGLMLDVSRHFFTKQEVERYIDEMAKYKFNVFHWHLTDDQGWRIEIKGLPALTRIGAWRVPRTGTWGTFMPPRPGEKVAYGGYYTQQDIKEIIRYAKQRFVTIVPEIDVPAHSLALIASYPGLSCTKLQYRVNPGSRLVKKETDDVLCVANDSTWLVLDKIITQVAELFPGQYIHVGGDEAYKGFWENCPEDKALMKRENITTAEGLQSYFEKKLARLVNAKGKKVIGWDETLEGGLAPGASVMSWRGIKGGIRAAQLKHHVVMSPYGSTYICQLQGNPLIEPHGPAMTRLQVCYNTNILPEGIDTAMVMGGEGCLWTEHIPNIRHAEYMTWPRALALSEIFWGTKSNWDDFINRVTHQFKYLSAAEVKYAPSLYDPIITPVAGENDSLRIKLPTEISGLELYYRFDGTDPDDFAPLYKGEPLAIPAGASQIRIISYQNGKPVGRQINCDLNDLRRKIRKK